MRIRIKDKTYAPTQLDAVVKALCRALSANGRGRAHVTLDYDGLDYRAHCTMDDGMTMLAEGCDAPTPWSALCDMVRKMNEGRFNPARGMEIELEGGR